MGTPEFAATVLRQVLDAEMVDVAAVYTQPDRPCGRGKKCQPGPVKLLALTRGLPVHQPETFKDPAEVATLAAYAPDVLLVAAYGMILPQTVLDIPRLMPLNVHASLLPAWRGAAPIERAIAAGDTLTGVTIMRMEAALDTGPMVLQRVLAIGTHDTAGSLRPGTGRPRWPAAGPRPQAAVTRLGAPGAPGPGPGHLRQEDRQGRGLYRLDPSGPGGPQPDPGHDPASRSGFSIGGPGRTSRPCASSPSPGEIGCPRPDDVQPGQILGLTDGKLGIACADAVYLIPTVTPAGKRAMEATAFACGYLGKCNDDAASAVCTPGRGPGPGAALRTVPPAWNPTNPNRKRLFIGLLCGTGLAVCALLALVWIIPYVGLANIHPLAPWLLGIVFAGIILVVLWATFGLAAGIALGRPTLASRHLRGVMAKVLLPLMTIFARLFHISKSRVRSLVHQGE